MRQSTVVVGASVAGVRTAQALRRNGYEGEVVVVDAETSSYDKPPLSKAMLLDLDAASVPLLTQGDAAAIGVELELGVAARALDLADSRVELADGRHLHFDDLVIATGASARPSPWGSPEGVHHLRSLADAEGLRADLHRGGRVAIVGGGFIGAEVASAARALGTEVAVIDPLPVPMGRIFGETVGRLFAGLHDRHQVSTHFGTGVAGIDRHGDSLRVQLSDGADLWADTVVVGLGVSPEHGWLSSSGLVVDDGVVCDRFSRARGQPRVHAVGDVARWHHPRYGDLVRVEHWTNAVEQAACVAYNITHPGAPRTYSPVEYVWSDQYDWRIQICGRPWSGVSNTMVGDPMGDERFAAFWSDREGMLCGSVSVNWPKATVYARRALAEDTAFREVHDAFAARVGGAR